MQRSLMQWPLTTHTSLPIPHSCGPTTQSSLIHLSIHSIASKGYKTFLAASRSFLDPGPVPFVVDLTVYSP